MAWLKKPATTGGAVYLLMVVFCVVGLVCAAFGAWRTGCLMLAGAFGVGFVVRALLPDDRAGMLGVRSRWVDLVALGAVAIAILVLVITTPMTPTP